MNGYCKKWGFKAATLMMVGCVWISCISSACARWRAEPVAGEQFVAYTEPELEVSQISDQVVFPNAQVEFIAGPQLKSGSKLNPAPWFDQNATAKGHQHGQAFPANPPPILPNGYGSDDGSYHNLNYYDQALVQYINYYRTNDPRFRDYARKIADSWWRSAGVNEGKVTDFDTYSFAPRSASLGGLMLRALDGRPEMWPWITAYTQH
ncbi:MAG TPA: hypothetical protein VM866_04200, partial [Pyrinomonadaceae bacterium]|nr:hypothetical protein [Pyrinomonadaceae bacterium]